MVSDPIPSAARGFSLLGVVVASGMVILVVFGVVGLLQATRRANARTEQRMVATFLAREAIELVRAIRDGNWLNAGACPETGPCTIFWRGPTTGPRAICNGVTARIEERSVDTDGLTAVDGDPRTSDDTNARLFRSGARYEHDHVDGEAGWVRTPYHRWVEIASATAPYADPIESDCGVASAFQRLPILANSQRPPAPFTVHAVVRWGPGADERVQLTEDLFPWINTRPFPAP